MRKLKAINYQLLAISLFFATTCFAQSVSSTDLIERAKDFDGKEIVFVGEAIGEIMPRNEFAWINVSDGNNTIGFWAKLDHLAGVKQLGKYSAKGDQLEIKGIFNQTCLIHGGDLDVHASEIKIIKSGSQFKHKLDDRKSKILLTLLIILCLVLTLQIYKIVLRKKLLK
jgi:hypothetical protein